MDTLKNKGFTDEPSSKDYFNISKYTIGLSKFIKHCKTPMTISVQGAWGTGKTSMMKMIENELIGMRDEDKQAGEKYRTIWFNAWQFSQFNMGEDLAATMLTCLIGKIGESDRKQTEQLLKKVGKLGKTVALDYVSTKFGSTAKNLIEEVVSKDEKPFNPIEVVDKLREDFKKCVEDALKRDQKERIVFFIDDLDRIEPKKAVEMLEVLKLFFDCENCVFLLAIDYEVVLKGVEAKYGSFSDSRKRNIQKGKDFFDKIIQVPFKVPVANYNMTAYIQNCLVELGMECTVEEAVIYEELVKTSIGTNPRTLKRMFNAFFLLNTMNEVNTENDNHTSINEILLFAILCLQHYDDDIYNYVVCNSAVLENGKIVSALEEEEGFGVDVDAEKFRELKPFFQYLFQIVGTGKEGYEKLMAALQLSAITGKTGVTKRVHRHDVSNAAELRFGDENDKMERVDAITRFIKSAGNDAEVEMFNQASGKGVICGKVNGQRFLESYARTGKYRFEFLLKSKNCELPGELISAMAADVWKRSGNRITCTIDKNDAAEMSVAEKVLGFAYTSWK